MDPDVVTFEIPPLALRLRVVALLGASAALQALAVFYLPWFAVDFRGHRVGVHLLSVHDHPLLSTGGGELYSFAMLALLLGGFYYLVRVAYLAITLLIGHPVVKRGLFRSKLQVAWLSPAGAHVHTAILVVLAIVATASVPTLHVKGAGTAFHGDLARSWGGFVMLAGLLAMHAALYFIARRPELAATQCWAPSAPMPPATTRPAPAPRPLSKRPLPPPPRFESDPFRAPPAPDLMSNLVRPADPVLAGPRADDPDAPPPQLLR